MLAAKAAYQTTTGNAVVRDEEGNAWVLKRDWLDTSMTRNEQLGQAINLFTKGTMIAFEKYNKDRHGLLGGGVVCFSS